MNELQLKITRFLAYKAQQKKRTTYQEVGEAIGWGHPTGRGLGNNLEVILHRLKDWRLPPLTTILVKKGERHPAEDAMVYIRNVLGDVNIDAVQASVFSFDWNDVHELQSQALKLPGGNELWQSSFGAFSQKAASVEGNTFLLKFNGALHGPEGISRPNELEDWSDKILHMPWNGVRASSSSDKSPGPKVAKGDLLFLWAHEGKEFGSGFGLTGVATAKEVIEIDGFLNIQLGDLALLRKPFGFKLLGESGWASAIVDRIDEDRHLRAWVMTLEEKLEIDQLILTYGSGNTLAKEDAEFRLLSVLDRALAEDKEDVAAAEEERKTATSKARPGQQKFRDQAMRRHSGQCVITGSKVSIVLEAAHVIPHTGNSAFEVPENSLILRRDVHALFDAGLIGINSKSGKLIVSPDLKNSTYSKLEGKEINHKLEAASLRYQHARFRKRLLSQKSTDFTAHTDTLTFLRGSDIHCLLPDNLTGEQ